MGDSDRGEVKEAPTPQDEEERIRELYGLDILDTPPEEEFDGLTRIASRICGSQISMINLLDARREWTKSAHGADTGDSPRENSVCQYTILQDGVLEIPDLREDPRFKNASYVTDEPYYRFYAAAPLTTSNGFKIGALCVVDREEHTLSSEQKEDLKTLAEEVTARIEMRKRQRELEALNSQKKELMNIVSHDMRNPLMGIIGAADFLLDQEEESREERKELVEVIKKSGERLLQIATELLDTRIVHYRKMEVNPVSCDPVRCIRNLLRLYTYSAANKELELRLNPSENVPEVNLDEQKFSRIIANLLSNAIKFTPRGGEITIEMEYEPRGDNRGLLRTSVTDTGIGIPEEEVDSLFERKNGDGRRGTDNEASYGLGLHIVMQLTEVLDAEIEVESEVDEGSRFELTVPVEVARN